MAGAIPFSFVAALQRRAWHAQANLHRDSADEVARLVKVDARPWLIKPNGLVLYPDGHLAIHATLAGEGLPLR